MRRYILLVIVLLYGFVNVDAQIIDTKSFLSFSGGKLLYGGPDNLFFPEGINNTGISFRADYLRNYLPWMKVGVEGSILFPGTPNQSSTDFSQVSSQNEKLITAGVNSTFFLPYKDSGWRNRLRFQIGIAPVVVIHQGTRTVSIDNIIHLVGTYQPEFPVIEIKGPSTGFGLSVTAALEYYLVQRAGIRLSLNSLFTSLKSDQSTEKIILHSLNFGLFFPLSRDKKLNY